MGAGGASKTVELLRADSMVNTERLGLDKMAGCILLLVAGCI